MSAIRELSVTIEGDASAFVEAMSPAMSEFDRAMQQFNEVVQSTGSAFKAFLKAWEPKRPVPYKRNIHRYGR